MKKEEICPFQLDKRIDKLEAHYDKLFERIEHIEQYINVKKAKNNFLERQEEREGQNRLKMKYMVLGVILTLITTLFERLIFIIIR